MTQTTINTTNAAEDLARMNEMGWKLIAVANGQWAGPMPSAIGLTMFFERLPVDACKGLPGEVKFAETLNSNSQSPSGTEVASGSRGIAANPLNGGGRRKK